MGLAAAAMVVQVYVGTYTVGTGSKGIYRFTLNLVTGQLTPQGDPTPSVNPSFLALTPSGRFLFAVNEVSAFAVEPSGALRFLNRVPSQGKGPCHLSVDGAARHVLVANYDSGSAAVLPVLADGHLGPAAGFVQHRGSSVHPTRQSGPHAHSIDLDRTGKLAFVADLGLDSVLAYVFDGERGTLAAQLSASLALPEGSGPRHIAQSADGRFVYVINELASTVSVFAPSEAGGRKEIQNVSTLPQGFTGVSTTAEIAISPDGRFLYGSNRGHDSLAIFSIDAATGRIALVGHQATLGKTPRHFAFDPSGAFLIAANQDSDSLAVFRVDRPSGRLSPVGPPAKVPRPVCVKMREDR